MACRAGGQGDGYSCSFPQIHLFSYIWLYVPGMYLSECQTQLNAIVRNRNPRLWILLERRCLSTVCWTRFRSVKHPATLTGWGLHLPSLYPGTFVHFYRFPLNKPIYLYTQNVKCPPKNQFKGAFQILKLLGDISIFWDAISRGRHFRLWNPLSGVGYFRFWKKKKKL